MRSRQGAKDVVVSAVPQLVGVVTGFFGSILVARGLGPAGMGQYALIMSLAGIATTLSDLGIGQTAIRYASRAAALQDVAAQMSVLRWALRWRLSLVFFVTTVFCLLAPQVARLWHSEPLTPYLRLGLLGGVFAALAAVPTIYFQSVKRFSTNASITSAQRLISFAGILALAALGLWSLRNLVIVNLVVSALAAFAFLTVVPKAAIWSGNALHVLRELRLRSLFAGPNVRLSAGELDSSSPTGFLGYMILSTVMVMLTMQADVWMMGYFLKTSDVGVYSVASRFTLPLTIATGALNSALWPRASGVTSSHQLLGLLKKTMALTALMAGLSTAYAICAPLLATILFGRVYAKSALLGQLLSLRCCLSMLICPLGVVSYGFGLVRIVWAINLAQLVAVIGLNLVLLPRIGAVGSAVALLVNETIGGVWFGFFFINRYRRLKREAA
jgi:O-antigen/teichoic acid export membrane protein